VLYYRYNDFTQLFALERKQIAIMAEEKSPTRISLRLFAINRSEMRNSVKNNADAIIFHSAICFRAKANSYYGRREIAYANFSSPLRDKSLRNEE
jgi:hypothetical protein